MAKTYNFMIVTEHRHEVHWLANRMRMHVFHFAHGAYPVPGASSTYPVNRLFLVTKSNEREGNYIADDNERVFLKENCQYFIPAMHRTTWRLSDDLQFYSVHFTLDELTGIDVFSTLQRIFRFEDERLEREIRAAWEEKDLYSAATQVKTSLYRLCGGMFRDFPEIRLNVSTRFKEFYETIVFIENNCSAKLTVSELAERLGMRADIFSKKFSLAVGMPPKSWLTRVLIRKAGELLLHKVSARQIAEQLGFNNEFYFSRFFKQHTGLTTRDFRRQYIA